MLSNRKDTSPDEWLRAATPASDRSAPPVSQLLPLWPIYTDDRRAILQKKKKTTLLGSKSEAMGVIFFFKSPSKCSGCPPLFPLCVQGKCWLDSLCLCKTFIEKDTQLRVRTSRLHNSCLTVELNPPALPSLSLCRAPQRCNGFCVIIKCC